MRGTSDGDILMMMGDDVEFKTPGWDVMVVRKFPSQPPP